MTQALNYKLRPAILSDMTLLFDWTNDPVVRRWSSNPNSIVWTDHLQWFIALLQDEHRYQWILEVNDYPVGQIRTEPREEGTYEVSLSVDSSYRSLGYGQLLLKMVHELFPSDILYGRVHVNNSASLATFRNARWHESWYHQSDFVIFTKRGRCLA